MNNILKTALLLLLICLTWTQTEGEERDWEETELEKEEFQKELLFVFKQYDTNNDHLLTEEEMFQTMEEELPNEQAIRDATEMIKSMFSMIDKDQNGLDWLQFKEMAQIPRTAFTDIELTSDQSQL